MTDSKRNGVFYTPQRLAKWMVEYIISQSGNTILSVLEPSCGTGVFIEELYMHKNSCGDITGVEIDKNACHKIMPLENTTIINEDFLFYNDSNIYDLIIGNPPYINKRILSPIQSNRCKEIHGSAGLKKRETSNIWTSFIIKSTQMLSSNGILAFVLPTEFLQVKFAEEIRDFLTDNFRRIEVITFKHLAFDSVEQDTIVLIAYKNSHKPEGVYLYETSNVDELFSNDLNFITLPKAHLNKKWSVAVLSQSEISNIDKLCAKVMKMRDYCDTSAGIVTAANSFFIVSNQIVEQYKLNDYTLPIIQRGGLVEKFFVFSCNDYLDLVVKNKPCFLLNFNNIKNLTWDTKQYLSIGESLEYDKRFKMQKRERWYDVPGISKGEAFFFKRTHHIPKLIYNEADVYVTDSAYKIRPFDEIDTESIVFSFYNSLTLLCCELLGRYYGGGVLEMTPNEFKDLPLPYVNKNTLTGYYSNLKHIESVNHLIQLNDQLILVEKLGFSEVEISIIKCAYQKVKARRLRTI
jgi:adenine-specific DNA-methyltransferase